MRVGPPNALRKALVRVVLHALHERLVEAPNVDAPGLTCRSRWSDGSRRARLAILTGWPGWARWARCAICAVLTDPCRSVWVEEVGKPIPESTREQVPNSSANRTRRTTNQTNEVVRSNSSSRWTCRSHWPGWALRSLWPAFPGRAVSRQSQLRPEPSQEGLNSRISQIARQPTKHAERDSANSSTDNRVNETTVNEFVDEILDRDILNIPHRSSAASRSQISVQNDPVAPRAPDSRESRGASFAHGDACRTLQTEAARALQT